MKQNNLLYFNLIKHFVVATAASADHWMALCGPTAPLVENISIYFYFFLFKDVLEDTSHPRPSVYRQCSCRSVSRAVCVIAVRRHTSRDQPLNQQAALSFFLSVKH